MTVTAKQNPAEVQPNLAVRTENNSRVATINVADDKAKVAAMTGWRRDLFGAKALELKHGRLALTVESGKVVTLEWQEAPDASVDAA